MEKKKMGRPRVLTDEQRKERQKEYLRKYWLKNKDKIKAVRKKNPNNAKYHKRWVEENIEHLREYRRNYIDKNREKINAYHREYYHRKHSIDKAEEV